MPGAGDPLLAGTPILTLSRARHMSQTERVSIHCQYKIRDIERRQHSRESKKTEIGALGLPAHMHKIKVQRETERAQPQDLSPKVF